MNKSDKELAVELAVAVINSIPKMQPGNMKPLSGQDIRSVLSDCFSAVKQLDNGM